MVDKLLQDQGVKGACPPVAGTALSSADADQAASRLAPHGLQSTGASAFPYIEDNCPGHVASDGNPKVCGRCGVHVDEFRPDEGEYE